MNDADCETSKSGNWDAYEKTLAPEYVGIGADGSKEGRAAMVADLKKPQQSIVTGCSTQVMSVKQVGDRAYLYGVYIEDGTEGAKHKRYHNVERFRDSWHRVNGSWLQTQSLGRHLRFPCRRLRRR